MAIGDHYCKLWDNLLLKFFLRYFGSFDLHSKIRLKPVIKYIKNRFKRLKNPLKILDFGCGDGIMLFELEKIFIEYYYYGYDNDKNLIDTAVNVSKKYSLNNKSSFYPYNINDYEEFPGKSKEKYDMVLLLDILEHLENPGKLLKSLLPSLKRNSYILVSVPSPNYKSVFGKKFHKSIGHKINGYNIENLSALFSLDNCELVYSKYNTGLFSNVGCFLYYRIHFENKYLMYFKSILLHFFSYLDFFNNEKLSCSLFAVYKII